MRDELEELAANPANRFKVHYTLDRPPAEWKYSSGFINPEMCEIGLPEAGKDSFIFACGPKPMIDFAVVPSLRSMGYADCNGSLIRTEMLSLERIERRGHLLT